MGAAERLNAVLTELDDELAFAVSARQAAEASVTQLQQQVGTLTGDVAARDRQIADLKLTIDGLNRRIAELEAQIPKPRVTLFGACPASPGGSSLSAALTVPGKWGATAAVRQFGTSFAPPNDHSLFSIVHTSYKQNNDYAGIIAGKYDAQISALAAATPAGHVVEWLHEHDKKVRDGVLTFDQLVAAKNRFYDVVKAAKRDVLVACTVTGWEFDPAAGRDIQRWAALKGDLLGIDCDGIHAASLPYPNFEGEIANAVAWVQRNGYRGWCVPEFGAPRLSTDASGSSRAAWATDYVKKFRDAGAQYVCLYDYESSPGNEFTTAAELNAWKAAVANR